MIDAREFCEMPSKQKHDCDDPTDIVWNMDAKRAEDR